MDEETVTVKAKAQWMEDATAWGALPKWVRDSVVTAIIRAIEETDEVLEDAKERRLSGESVGETGLAEHLRQIVDAHILALRVLGYRQTGLEEKEAGGSDAGG